jgi:hypothetical protein
VLHVELSAGKATYLCIGLDDKQSVVPSHGAAQPWPDEYAYDWSHPHPAAPASDSAAVGAAMARSLGASCSVDVDTSLAGAAFSNAFRAAGSSLTRVGAQRRLVVDTIVLKPHEFLSVVAATSDPLTGITAAAPGLRVTPPPAPPASLGDSARVSLHVFDSSPDGAVRMTFHYVFARGPGAWTLVSRDFARAEGSVRRIGTIPPFGC